MSVTVKDFCDAWPMPPARCRANAARASSPAARWSCARSMRAIRSIATIVRSTDPTFSADLAVVRARGARRRRHHGGDSRRARTGVSASRGARGRRPGGARDGDRRRQSVRAVALRRFRGSAARARCDGRCSPAASAARDCRSKNFLRSRDRGALWSRASRSIGRRRRRSGSAKVTRVQPKGISVLSIAAQLPLASGGCMRRADRLWRHGPDAGAGQSGRARARRPRARRRRHRARARGRGRRHRAGDDAIASAW